MWRWAAPVALAALLLRAAVGLHPYSGAGDAPRFGDYEAQRHWMELAVNLPPREWCVFGQAARAASAASGSLQARVTSSAQS
jgi:hypothetical protein